MTDRTMSPTAAATHARKAVRARFKILRQDPRPVVEVKVDSPHVFAGRIASLLKDAASDHPGEWSESYTEFVVNRFADRYVELCRVAPLVEKAGAR